LLLCAAVCVLWVRSYLRRDAHEFNRQGVRWEVASDKGRLVLSDAPQRRRDEEESYRITVQQSRAMWANRARWKEVFDGPGGWWPLSARSRELNRIVKDWERGREARSKEWMAAHARTRITVVSHSLRHAAVAAATAALPTAWLTAAMLARHRRRRRLRQNRCPVCGYDLRVSPSRCPECGAVPGAAPRRTA
jgi:predicted Zn-ribbon and HTH transcriptional regulator